MSIRPHSYDSVQKYLPLIDVTFFNTIGLSLSKRLRMTGFQGCTVFRFNGLN